MRKPNITVIGSLNIDLVTTSPRFPRKGETILGTDFKKIPGGKGANQAVSLARLGSNISIIGCIGDDDFGDQIINCMKKEAINTQGINILPKVTTGIAMINVAEGDNCIIVVSGCNSKLSCQDIDKNEEIIKFSDLILLQLEIPVDVVCYSIKKAKKYNKKVILNPAPVCSMPKSIYKYIDYITPNRSELSLLSGIEVKDDDSLFLAMNHVLKLGVKNVITTLGSDGVAYLTKDGNMEKCSSFKVDVIDTTGAGDAFNGGLAYSLAIGLSLEKSVLFASKVSALSVTKFGAQNGMPYLKEVEEVNIRD